MNYTLNQLRIFLKVAELESVTNAAKELHITQPAISIQLKNFQNQFDIPLYETINRRIFITDFGKEIAQMTNEILNMVAEINYKTLDYKGLLVGKLNVSVVSTGKYVMPYFLTDFMNTHPNVELNMTVTNKKSVIESIERNEVDFSLVSILPQRLKVDKFKLLQNKLFLVGSPKLNKENPLTICKKTPFIYRENGSSTRDSMEEFVEENNLSASKKIELTSNEAVKQAVLAGMGYSIMPLIGIKNELKNKDLEIIPFTGLPIVTNWHLIWLKEKKLSPVALSFLNYIKSERNRILEDVFNWYEQF